MQRVFLSYARYINIKITGTVRLTITQIVTMLRPKLFESSQGQNMRYGRQNSETFLSFVPRNIHNRYATKDIL